MLQEIQNTLDKIRRSYGTYIVRKGDTLWDIARKSTGNGMNYKQIQSMNNLNDKSIIRPGQQIIIPMKNPPGVSQQNQPETQGNVNVNEQTDNTQQVSQVITNQTTTQPISKRKRVVPKSSVKGTSYTIKKGDTLWDIAQATYGNGYKWKQIAQDNGLDENSIYYPGDTLILRDVDNTKGKTAVKTQPMESTQPVAATQPTAMNTQSNTSKSTSTQNDQYKNRVDNTFQNRREQVMSTESKHYNVFPLKYRPSTSDTYYANQGKKNHLILQNIDNVAIPIGLLSKILYGNGDYLDYTFTIGNNKYDTFDLIQAAIGDANVNDYFAHNDILYTRFLRQCYKEGFENTVRSVLKKVYPKRNERTNNYEAKMISNNLRRATGNARFK